MVIQFFELQERQKIKSKYNKNIKEIIDLDDICVAIDVLVKRINNIDCDFKYNFINKLIDMKLKFISKTEELEESNLKIMKKI